MPWGRLDDGLYDHPKLDELGRHRLTAVGLWTVAISWCNRRLTDGFVPTERIRMLGGTVALADVLVSAGMFDQAEGGYQVHDFLTFNESREQVELRREADRKRKRKPDGVQPETTPESTPDSAARQPARPAGARPGPASPVLETPQPPTRGGRRADGTSQRQVAARLTADIERRDNLRRERRRQRDLARLDGRITDAQYDDMNERDADLEEIPTERGAAYAKRAS